MDFKNATQALLEALDTRLECRTSEPHLLPRTDHHKSAEMVREFKEMLTEYGVEFCTAVKTVIKDCTVSRIYLKELKGVGQLTQFFKDAAAVNLEVAEEFRAWLQKRFDGRIYLVGDSRYAGYALEFKN